MSKGVVRAALEVLGVREDEERIVLLMVVHSFFLGAAVVFFETAATALFLSTYESSALPYAYIGGAVVVTLAGLVYAFSERRATFPKLLVGTLFALALAICGLRGALSLTTSKAPVFALLIFVEVLTTLLSLEFWGLAGRLFDVRQGKRLFGLVGSGDILAGILGGLLVPIVVGPLGGAPNLLFLSALALVLGAGALAMIVRSSRTALSTDSAKEEEKGGERAGGRDGYLLGVFALASLSMFGFYFVDYVYLAAVETKYPSEASLAAFFGFYKAAVGIVTLLGGTLLTGRLLNRYGLLLGLAALPAVVVAGMLALALAGPVGLAGGGVVLTLAVAMKLADDVLRVCLQGPSARILYQPLAARIRVRVHAQVEGVVEPVAAGVAGGVLLLTTFAGLDAPRVAIVATLFVAGWLVVSLLVRRGYTAALTSALSKRTQLGEGFQINDASSLAVLERFLASPEPSEAIGALSMLESVQHESLRPALVKLLDHPAPGVKVEALRRIASWGPEGSDALPALRRLFGVGEPAAVRSAALRAYCAIAGERGVAEVAAHVEDPDSEVRFGAMAGLLQLGHARETFLAKVHSPDPRDRELAARVLGEVGTSSHEPQLIALLGDADVGVRRAALTAASRFRGPEVMDLVASSLAHANLRGAASGALVAADDDAVPVLERLFEETDQTRVVRKRIALLWGRMRGGRSLAALLARLETPYTAVRLQLLASLVQRGYREPLPSTRVSARIRAEFADATWALAALADVGEGRPLLARSLLHEVEGNVACAFHLLALVHDPHAILRVWGWLSGKGSGSRAPTGEERARAIEMLDNVIDGAHKRPLFALLEDRPLEERLESLRETFPVRSVGRTARLAELSERAGLSPWTTACAIHEIAALDLQELLPQVRRCLESPAPVVRETALWSLARLGSETAVFEIARLEADAAPRVASMARSFARLGTVGGGEAWMSDRS